MKIPEKRDLQFLTGVGNSQMLMWLLDVIKRNISLITFGIRKSFIPRFDETETWFNESICGYQIQYQ